MELKLFHLSNPAVNLPFSLTRETPSLRLDITLCGSPSEALRFCLALFQHVLRYRLGAMESEKWALITGVSEGGLGDALAKELMSRGINVIASNITHKLMQYLEPCGNGKLEKVELDVTSPSSISAAVKEVERITGVQLWMLVNNAGYGYMMPLMDADVEQVKRNFDVNVFGLLAVTQAFFHMLRAARGIVVNQGSIAGLPGVYQPFIGIYSANKTAVVDMSNTMRLELAPFGVRVRAMRTCIKPC